MTPAPVLLVLGGLVGACLGSFAVTVGLRAARGEQALAGRSRCDACGHPLDFVRTIPLVSYAVGRGRCGYCGGAIDPLHPVGEIAGLAIGVVCLLVGSPVRAGLLAALGLTLLGAAATDIRALRLPDRGTALIAVLALALDVVSGWQPVMVGLLSGLVTLGGLELLRRGYLAARGRPGLGQGDVKLLAALSIWLGLATPWALAAAAGLGLVWALAARPAGGERFAFGPFLALGGWLVGLAVELGLVRDFGVLG